VRTSTDVRDHGCQGRVTRHRPDRRERSPVGRRKRGKSQKLNRKATPRKRGRQRRPPIAVNSRPQKGGCIIA